jgi:putative transposase
MTHQEYPNVLEQVLELLVENGFDGLADACRILYNEAMKIERADVLQAQPYERTDCRRGYANGFKPKTVQTRIGKIALAIPQTRGIEFYPQAFERGVARGRASWQYLER